MEDLTEPVGEAGAPTPPVAEGAATPISESAAPTGPLAPLFAQVREYVTGDIDVISDLDETDMALAALSSIERHVQDMEKALHEIAYAKERQPVKKTTGVRGEPRFIHSWPSRSVALAALPAREKGRE